MGEGERITLRTLLHRAAKPFRLALGRDPRRQASQPRRSHSENVCVEVVGVHDIYFVFFQKIHAAAELLQKVSIIKTVERIFGNFPKVETLDFVAQYAAIIETRKMHSVKVAFL